MNKQTITYDNVIRQKVGLDVSEIDGEFIMINVKNGKYYGFNSVASRIWELIQKPIIVENIINIMLGEFQVNKKECEDTVFEFISRLNNEELILID